DYTSFESLSSSAARNSESDIRSVSAASRMLAISTFSFSASMITSKRFKSMRRFAVPAAASSKVLQITSLPSSSRSSRNKLICTPRLLEGERRFDDAVSNEDSDRRGGSTGLTCADRVKERMLDHVPALLLRGDRAVSQG